MAGAPPRVVAGGGPSPAPAGDRRGLPGASDHTCRLYFRSSNILILQAVMTLRRPAFDAVLLTAQPQPRRLHVWLQGARSAAAADSLLPRQPVCRHVSATTAL